MKLVDARTLQLVDFFESDAPKYAILSHTWEKDEVLFSDMADLVAAREKTGFAKLEGACDLAVAMDYHYIWIDNCCIDKSSSAELSEAINSMYRWYANASVCFAYLSDIDELAELRNARWFTRGWTLQELIAPKRVQFHSRDWSYLGTKDDPYLTSIISEASRVDECVLVGTVLPMQTTIARRMYWASDRHTTRPEDEAYCLMGLFDVHMPLIYGEGQKAFRRLQEEIIRTSTDQSILAWYWLDPEQDLHGDPVLAPSVRSFCLSGDVALHQISQPRSMKADDTMSVSNRGLELSMTLITADNPPADDRPARSRPFSEKLAIVNCQMGPVPGTFPVLTLRSRTFGSPTPTCWRLLHRFNSTPQSISLHDSSAFLEKGRRNFGLGAVGAESHPSGFPGSALAVEMKNRRFTKEKLTLSYIEMPASVSTLRPDSDPELGHIIHIFWLVPVIPRGQQITLTVSKTFPSHLWDTRCFQLRTPLSQTCELDGICTCTQTKGSGSTPALHRETAGAASIECRSRVVIPGQGPEKLVIGKAFVIFGTEHVDRNHPQDIHSPVTLVARRTWCHLIKDDGKLTLDEIFALDPSTFYTPSSTSSLALGAGRFTLKATVEEGFIGYTPHQLVRLSVGEAS
ncbi:heterokaryon incompatibility protein-domain-containing protein [Podospora didyma]|uniref:Heterokaryon incompatibility protein-domain-containing protein n=1 Tax=Podospora didyma TaxID=330526 RepID=A0AAE0N919_9PEZI|nr:heterokaryon incompatibility protein-domain-containing protein [Podospora didyma]